MVFKNGFSVEIIPEDGEITKFTRDDQKYIGLNNHSVYKIKLGNHRDTICDVDLDMEGKHVGRWRINSHDYIVIERPAEEARKFTFFSEMSMEAIESGVSMGEFTNGLIKATFYPKKPVRYRQIGGEEVYTARGSAPSMMQAAAASPQRFESGVTLLGEESYQEFGRIRGLRSDEIDWSNVTTIYLRLVARKHRPRYTTIPPRIEDLY